MQLPFPISRRADVASEPGSARFKPYVGGHSAFKIGLKPLDLQDWLIFDDNYDLYIDEKKRLLAERPADVFVAEPGSEPVQEEVLQLVRDHLANYPVRPGTHEAMPANQDEMISEGKTSLPELLLASLQVQEDLLVMQHGNEGWYLSAGSLSFPSSWSLKEKFGHPLDVIHGPVPGFGRGTRNAMLIDRIFNSLQVEKPVWRMNWSIYGDADLFHPTRKREGIGENPLASFVRVEYQTLRKLPETGAILFTVRIFLDPLTAIARLKDRRHACEKFKALLLELNDRQLEYKGLSGDRQRLINTLDEIAHSGDIS